MKMSEILRGLADKLAAIEQSQGNPQSDKSMGGIPVANIPGNNSNTNNNQQMTLPAEPELSDEPLMVPPLQQKHELLKKVAGVDNTYGNDDQPEQGGELVRMRKMAGIVVAGDENDIN